MTVEELQEQIKRLEDTQFQQLLAWVVTEEKDRRAAQPAIEQAQAEIITELQDAGKLEKPEVATEEQAKEDAARVPEWKNPGTTHSLMYHYGDVVRYKDKLVRSTHKGLNHWEPTTHGVDEHIWLDITDRYTNPQTEEPGTGEVRQFAPGLDVAEGDIISYEGAHYRVLSAHTTATHWPPDQSHALFEKL